MFTRIIFKLRGKMNNIIFGVVLTTLFFFSCTDQKPPTVAIIARVGENYLTNQALNSATPRNLDDEQIRKFQKKYVNDWVKKQILLDYMGRQKIELNEIDQIFLEEYRYQLLMTHLVNSFESRWSVVTDVEIQNYYNSHIEEFKRDEDEVNLVLLFLEQPNIGIQDDIKLSNSLLDVIDKNYLNLHPPSQMEKNGELGYTPVSKFYKSISNAIKRYKSGQISRPIETAEGIYYIQVLDYQSAGTFKDIPLVRQSIMNHIQQAKLNQILEDIVQEESQNKLINKFFDKLVN